MKILTPLAVTVFLSAAYSANAQEVTWTIPNTFDGNEITGEALDENFAAVAEALAQLQEQNAALMADNAALQNFIAQVLPYLTGGTDAQGNPAVYFSGVNVYVNNGAGLTRSANGLGNLVVGYDESEDPATATSFCSDGYYDNSVDCINNGDTWAASQKTGSHNLVVGSEHSYTQYGGLVAGWKNRVTGIFATVSGGRKNSARGYYSSISGGGDNTATTSWAAVSGGRENTADGMYASVSGGAENEVTGKAASISGGRSNHATGGNASVSGGYQNMASGSYSGISGGKGSTASGGFASVGGGYGNHANAEYSTVSGGYFGVASGWYDWIAGALFQDD